jgi:hypothetical protein
VNTGQDEFDPWAARLEDFDEVSRPRVSLWGGREEPRVAKPPVRQQKIAPLNAILIHHSVSWMWKSKIQVFGLVDIPPGRMSYWIPGRKNSEGVSWKA